MVAVMLVSLCFFMIVSPILVSRSDINLPSTVVNNNKELKILQYICSLIGVNTRISLSLYIYIYIV